MLGLDHILLDKRYVVTASTVSHAPPKKGYYIIGDLYAPNAAFIIEKLIAGPIDSLEKVAMCLHFIDASKMSSEWETISSTLHEMYGLEWDIAGFLKDFFPIYDTNRNVSGVIKNITTLFYDEEGVCWHMEQSLEG